MAETRFEVQRINDLWRVVDLDNPRLTAPAFATEEIAKTVARVLNSAKAEAKGA